MPKFNRVWIRNAKNDDILWKIELSKENKFVSEFPKGLTGAIQTQEFRDLIEEINEIHDSYQKKIKKAETYYQVWWWILCIAMMLLFFTTFIGMFLPMPFWFWVQNKEEAVKQELATECAKEIKKLCRTKNTSTFGNRGLSLAHEEGKEARKLQKKKNVEKMVKEWIENQKKYMTSARDFLGQQQQQRPQQMNFVQNQMNNQMMTQQNNMQQQNNYTGMIPNQLNTQNQQQVVIVEQPQRQMMQQQNIQMQPVVIVQPQSQQQVRNNFKANAPDY